MVAADNDVYTALAIVAMAVGLVAYCRWRQRHLYEINEALMLRFVCPLSEVSQPIPHHYYGYYFR